MRWCRHLQLAKRLLVLALQVVLRAPATLELSVEDSLEPRVAFLREVAGVPQDSIAKVSAWPLLGSKQNLVSQLQCPSLV